MKILFTLLVLLGVFGLESSGEQTVVMSEQSIMLMADGGDDYDDG